jgi:hypothetical protein
MKRWLLPASALVLVVTACGAGAKSAPRVMEVGARVPGVQVIAARREQAAAREATRVIRGFVAPPGAHQIRKPRYGEVLHESGAGPVGESVSIRRFWSVRKRLKTVIAFLRAHRLQGFEPSGATWGSRKPHYLTMNARGPAARGGPPTRFVDVTSVGLPHRTLIGVDVEVGWTYPRSPLERVPPATRMIVVRTPKASATATDPTRVAQIARWFDALPISPPGIAIACPLTLGADISVSFRSARGTWLAQANLPPTAASICDSITFSIGGSAQRPLIDRADGKSFVQRLQELLGIRLLRVVR